ncbi:5'-nucleotidase domain-containing protein 3-like isoform X3 [Dysidea avara]|uniref:5'-nucleotidase domain-containing protein 3-like isoform X3 n=1 Tax=Dysidea avara TaxID=196820 RepID=UPI0033221269
MFRRITAEWRSIIKFVRYLGSTSVYQRTASEIRSSYEARREGILRELSAETAHVNRNGVFVNSDIMMKHIDVYGFDYDYTLVSYNNEVPKLIYDHAKKLLVEKFLYPREVKHLQYDPNFAIRGLHLDVKTGYLMKVDANNHIQLGSVYRGHEAVNNEKVFEVYRDTHLSMDLLDTTQKESQMKYFSDLFSLPEVTLYCDLSQLLIDKEIPFGPEYLYSDVKTAVTETHKSGVLYNGIVSDIGKYIHDCSEVLDLLQHLKSNKKNLFLISNSPYWFVDQGMRHLTNTTDWVELFDVVIVQARKPDFYFNTYRPFRLLDRSNGNPTWTKVTKFTKGHVYQEGNILDFVKHTGWRGSRVLYLGDHLYSDLADPTLKHGWKTGAIIPELQTEVEKINSTEMKEYLSQLLANEFLFSDLQRSSDEEARETMKQWRLQHKTLRVNMKEMFNPRFGSLFRTEKAPTYFTRWLGQFAHLYTSKVQNFIQYPLDFTFYPRRFALPHETPFY